MGKVNEEQMTRAINAYKNDKLSFKDAATLYGVKKSTLNDRLKGRGNKPGAKTKLNDCAEKLIVKQILTCCDMGMGFSRHQILDIVERYLKDTKQTELFKNGRPSEDWYYGFMERHKDELSIKVPSKKEGDKPTTSSVVELDPLTSVPFMRKRVSTRWSIRSVTRQVSEICNKNVRELTKNIKRCVSSLLVELISRNQSKAQLSEMFEKLLKELTEIANRSVLSLQDAIESAFGNENKARLLEILETYSKELTETNNHIVLFLQGKFESDFVVNKYSNKAKEFHDKEAKKRTETKSMLEVAYTEATKLDPSFKKKRLEMTNNSENIDPIYQYIQSIPSAKPRRLSF
jgi:galactitol-specific phosphotransferase system IIB component